MIKITAKFDDKENEKIVTEHINSCTATMVQWYTTINEAKKYLPLSYCSNEAQNVINHLIYKLKCEKLLELDMEEQFALASILEEEEKILDPDMNISVDFSIEERKELDELFKEDISLYENVDN